MKNKFFSPGWEPIRNEVRSVITSVKQAFTFLIPVFMIGAFALSIEYFPIAAVRQFIGTAANGWLYRLLDLIYSATYGFAAVYLVMAVSYNEAQRVAAHTDTRLHAVMSSVACYFGFMGPDVFSGEADLLLYTKMANIFSALLISLICTRLFFVFHGWFYKKHPRERTTAFERGLHAIAPFLCCLFLSACMAMLVSLIPDVCNFNDLVIKVLNKPFEKMGGGFFSGFLILLSISVLWMFGIHGSNVYDSLLTASEGAFAVGGGSIATKPFFDTFALMGGCGTTVCLLIAILIFGRNRKNRRLGKLSALPALFNINETLIFGLPIVFNPIYAVPFILTPLVTYSVAYLATAIGLVPQIVNTSVQWTTPIVISGYQATGSVAGSVLQVILLVIGVAIYAPFIRMAETLEKKNAAKNIETLTAICKECELRGERYALECDSISLRATEDSIASKLDKDIANGAIGLHYQPQVENGRVVSAEALLRFSMDRAKGKGEKFLYPPLVVGIAVNYGLFDAFSRATVVRTMQDLKSIQETQDKNFRIAVNLRFDLLKNNDFRTWLVEMIRNFGLTPHTFGVEITEDADLSDADACLAAFDELKQAGAEILMDDFSMGHTSITILQKNIFDYIKIDGNLIKALDNERSRSIVASVVSLGKELGVSVIAEYVETEKQRDILREMGCGIFQGYYYYRAMPFGELKTVLHENANKPCEATQSRHAQPPAHIG